MASDCDKDYDYWGYFWAALLAIMATVIVVTFFYGRIAAPVAVLPTPLQAAPVAVMPTQNFTQTAAPINITVTTAPPVQQVKLRTTVVYRYVKQPKPHKHGRKCKPCQRKR